jgi:hypothetical protein
VAVAIPAAPAVVAGIAEQHTPADHPADYSGVVQFQE